MKYNVETETEKKHPKLLRAFLGLTSEDKRIPTDPDLDYKIGYLADYMHVVWPLFKHIIKKKIWFYFRYKWKTWLRNLAIVALGSVVAYFLWFKVVQPKFIKEQKIIVKEIYVTNLKTFSQFVHDVGFRESRNTWNMHRDGSVMLGYFQFEPNTLKGIGINVEPEYFLNDSNLQIAAFKLLMHKNKEMFQKYINKWANKPLPQDRRYVMTESGILMAFHLKPAGAIQYFESGCIDDSNTDGNGTPVSYYIKEFSGYKTEY